MPGGGFGSNVRDREFETSGWKGFTWRHTSSNQSWGAKTSKEAAGRVISYKASTTNTTPRPDAPVPAVGCLASFRDSALSCSVPSGAAVHTNVVRGITAAESRPFSVIEVCRPMSVALACIIHDAYARATTNRWYVNVRANEPLRHYQKKYQRGS